MHFAIVFIFLVQVVDGLIVIFALLDQGGVFGSGVAKILRLFRSLRPLRLIKRNKSLRILIEVVELFLQLAFRVS
jgi:hypothetical protein